MSILSIDQIAAIRGTTPEAMTAACSKHSIPDCAKCKDAARKAKQRAAAKELKSSAALQAEIQNAPDIKSFWALSLKTADPDRIAAFRATESELFDFLYYVERRIKGIYDVSPDDEGYISVEDGDAEFKDIIAKHGTINRPAILQLDNFWANPHRIERFRVNQNADSIYALYGITTAVPEVAVADWTEYVREYRRQLPPTKVELKCADCETPTTVDSSTADAYKGVVYRCQPCIKRAEEDASTCYDTWGRLKT
jgi:hypothetical protein